MSIKEVTVGSIISDPSKEPIKGRASRNYVEGEIPVITIGNITKEGDIDLRKVNHITKEEHENEAKETQVKHLDIIMAITGATIGKVAIVPNNLGECNICGDIVKFRVKDNTGINPYFVAFSLLTECCQLQIQRHITGSTNRHLSPSDIKKIKIPVSYSGSEADFKIQSDLVETMIAAKNNVKDLRTKADKLFEEAREKFASLNKSKIYSHK